MGKAEIRSYSEGFSGAHKACLLEFYFQVLSIVPVSLVPLLKCVANLESEGEKCPSYLPGALAPALNIIEPICR